MRRFVPVLVALLSGASSGLAGAAADVLSEIVLKRMEPEAKLRCSAWNLSWPACDFLTTPANPAKI